MVDFRLRCTTFGKASVSNVQKSVSVAAMLGNFPLHFSNRTIDASVELHNRLELRNCFAEESGR